MVCVLVAWAAVSVANVPPLRNPVTPNEVGGPLGAVAGVGVILYAFAAAAYFRIYRRRGDRLAFAVTLGFALLAEALVVVVVSLTTSWHLSWWEWHALMLLGFISIARGGVARVARGAFQRPLSRGDAARQQGGQRAVRRPRRLHAVLRGSATPPRCTRCWSRTSAGWRR